MFTRRFLLARSSSQAGASQATRWLNSDQLFIKKLKALKRFNGTHKVMRHLPFNLVMLTEKCNIVNSPNTLSGMGLVILVIAGWA
ncbi:hypothetical protein A3D14_03125 [Candidatus Saccharibacteria bacterium RIFCSPHIGHO2_02_FULL_47_12]|nr:MAG: hypothetical protein A3D14_03125 [Candidatus Saccharibacteria bacterium RIFCSPHIGHO2_02_FULL_47_12]